MITTHSVEQGTETWAKLREGLYTGSNAHKLLKFGATPYALTHNSEFQGNFHTRRGLLLEDEAIEFYEEIKDTTVERPGFVTNSKYPLAGYSPDGLAGDYLIEVKCFSAPKHLEIVGGTIPLPILAQIHFGMVICEKRKAHLVVYNPRVTPEAAFRIIEIPTKQAIENNFKRIIRSVK